MVSKIKATDGHINTDVTISHMANVPRLVITKSSGNNRNQENRFALMEELINGVSINLHPFESATPCAFLELQLRTNYDSIHFIRNTNYRG